MSNSATQRRRQATGIDVTGVQQVLTDNAALSHQLFLRGAGTVTVSVYPPGDLDADGNASATAIGPMTIEDGIINLASDIRARNFLVHADAIVIEGTGTFSYTLISG